MRLPAIFQALGTGLQERQLEELLQTNEESAKYGLILTAEAAAEIIEGRNRVLQSRGRVELGLDTTKMLIKNFCASSFLNQEEYVATLHELHELFYYLKNRTEDKIGDAELIGLIKDCFENSCGGSLELLRDTMEAFAENFARQNQLVEYLPEGEGE